MKSNQYNLKKPKQRWDLPKELEEISGLSYYKNDQLACVQDEKGILFFYDLAKGEVIREDKFAGKGDYEGVEIIDKTAYVLRSDGNIYFFSIDDKGLGKVKHIKTELSRRNDTEGLGYHFRDNELLVACKEDPGIGDSAIENSRAVYGISLSDNSFREKPKYIISEKDYHEMIQKKGLSKHKHMPFKPSGIAVHPETGYIFIICSVGKILVILNPDGALGNLIPLDPKLLIQPEGICFSPKGDLYISSEGKGGLGYILKF